MSSLGKILMFGLKIQIYILKKCLWYFAIISRDWILYLNLLKKSYIFFMKAFQKPVDLFRFIYFNNPFLVSCTLLLSFFPFDIYMKFS